MNLGLSQGSEIKVNLTTILLHVTDAIFSARH